MTSREDPARFPVSRRRLIVADNVIYWRVKRAVCLYARFFTVIDVHHGRSRPYARTENKGALSVTRNAPTDVITTYVLLETSAYSRDARSATNDAINYPKNGCSLKLRGDGDLHLQS
ncbi:hypothetical protein X777_05195 [Ooceraea biroi]|uniref:Uncharacterized protein n=1 Tax=Ooceraea biroi TaxID=2015173 RepID=A0A026WGU9_OOCBI|nr:hypothetical protein X777_05195 [Ooceraea biroi]